MSPSKSRTVWSSQGGDQRQNVESKQAANVSWPPQQQTAYLHRASKGRGGKEVTLIKNLRLTEADLASLAKTLKQAVGSGGTVKEGVIEIQGGQREKLAEALRKLGYQVKFAGG